MSYAKINNNLRRLLRSIRDSSAIIRAMMLIKQSSTEEAERYTVQTERHTTQVTQKITTIEKTLTDHDMKTRTKFIQTLKGWDAIPEDQRVKFVTLSKHIQAHPDYQSKVADNKDSQNRDLAFKKILDEVMGQQRKKELELYKLYAKDDSFYQAFFDTMKRIKDSPRQGR